MSRESRILYASADFPAETVVSHYEAFGWELLSINGNQITMSRETQNPHFVELVKYQAKYEEKLKEYNALPVLSEPRPIDLKICFWSFVALVLPFVAYITYKIVKKKQYREAHAALCAQKAALRAQMEDIALQSRGVFFGKE